MVYHGARKEPGNSAPGPVTIKATGLGGDEFAVSGHAVISFDLGRAVSKRGCYFQHSTSTVYARAWAATSLAESLGSESAVS